MSTVQELFQQKHEARVKHGVRSSNVASSR
jgi:hypothetical protein